jgi:hypothetical protein
MIDPDRLVAVLNEMPSEAELASQRIAPSHSLINDTNSTAVIQPDLVNSNHLTNFFVGNIRIYTSFIWIFSIEGYKRSLLLRLR